MKMKSKMDCGVIRFWDQRTETGWLSNFYPAQIIYRGKMYSTSEHLYQSLKCDTEGGRERVRNKRGPKSAKRLAHEIGKTLTIHKKAENMRIAIKAKFDQHPDLKRKLTETHAQIVEASPIDFLWGEGSGHGLNLMGMLLMELRVIYAAQPPPLNKP